MSEPPGWACPQPGGFGCREGERAMPGAALEQVPAGVPYRHERSLSDWCQKCWHRSSFLVFDLSCLLFMRFARVCGASPVRVRVGGLSEVLLKLFVLSGLAVALVCLPSSWAAEASPITSSIPEAVAFAVVLSGLL